ncbi:unnamed protein product [Fraxinus pennsylvanica]|uniref:Small ribosomal subunit protein mS29 n=1 Tax=Fraxinus pennsylvanica TaxID=56036 RepID=A0AAD1Z1W1_9LAMI|nr:unnamed protein product [Fraxinus pennsylvanica]
MLLRALRRTTAIAASAAASSTLTKPPHSYLSISRPFSANTTKANLTKAKKSKSKSDGKEELQVTDTEFFVKQDEELRRRQLAEDENNPALDVGPNGRPLFTSTPSISLLTKKDACSYMKFSVEELNKVLPEGLPMGMVKEFEESSRSALLIRQSFLDLRDNFRRAVDPSLLVGSKGSKVQKQIVLDGPMSCGKSIALAMLVHWAREEGWLVLYVPSGREWTHGGLFYKNPQTGLWDTPVQAATILQDFSKYNESLLKKLKCNTLDPIPLGEGAGVGWPKGIDKMQISEDSTLYDLVQAGINNSHAAVGVVVRLRKELSDVKDTPVLIAIDQYNSWFTFSEYEEPVTVRSCRPVHARELATVNAFRSMLHENDMMVGAFSHSTAVGKLRQQLPDVPTDARINFPRYNLDEAASVCHYYLRQRLVSHDAFSEENWKKIYYLSNGNGTEMRYLVPFMR